MRARKIVLFVAAVAALVGGLGAETPTASAAPNPLGEFTSLTPTRILDTRDGNGTGGKTTPIGPNSSIDVQITGRGGVPATGVSAVVLNTTVLQVSSGSYLSVWPTGAPRPLVSNLNPTDGQTIANQVTVKVGSGGKVSAYNALGQAHVLFDVAGYYSDSTGPSGARYKPLAPARLFDTRNGGGGVPPLTPLEPEGVLNFKVTGKGGVPETGVTGIVMNVTATETTDFTYITAYPSDQPRPLASSLNLGPVSTVPNLVTVRVPADGMVSFYNAAGKAHLLADVVGYYTTGITTNEGRFIPVDPVRAFDTREEDWPLGPDEEGIFTFGDGNPGISAMAFNVTAAEASDWTYVTVFPHDACARPLASNINVGPGQIRPNSVISGVSNLYDGRGCDYTWDWAFRAYNAQGEVHLIVDLFGIFTDASGSASARSADLGIQLPEDLHAERVA